MVPRGDGPGMLNEEKVLSKYKGPKVLLKSGAAIGLAAVDEALTDAGFTDDVLDNLPETEKERMGICIGSPITRMEYLEESNDKLDPDFALLWMTNSVATNVSARYGLKGPYFTTQTACATGLHSIGDSFRAIRSGDADFMLAGGAHGPITPFVMCLYSRNRAMTTNFNDAAEKASRPFDRDRDGFILSEGASILVLEEYEKAKARHAHIYSEILGYGMSGDAYHMSAPHPDGDGAYNAMAAALKDAHVSPENISYVNAHATSTVLGDAAENVALLRLFGKERAGTLAVSGLKGALGHMVDGSGAFELACTSLALEKREIPPTINLDNLESTDKYPLNYVPNQAQQLPSDAPPLALKNAFGMGGANASVCIGTV
jgi:3-oxoacyl-[acyl-carrier-protein] synthase II